MLFTIVSKMYNSTKNIEVFVGIYKMNHLVITGGIIYLVNGNYDDITSHPGPNTPDNVTTYIRYICLSPMYGLI